MREENRPEGLERPWPRPPGRPAMRMTWHELLFAHWPLPVEVVAASLPAGLEVDTFDAGAGERAWLGVVPFRMAGVRLRGLPPAPGAGAFPELNLRTYVRPAGSPTGGPEARPGVWFYSLDAASRLAVTGARVWFGLPYVHARMSCERVANGATRFASRRTRGHPAPVECEYSPQGDPFRAAPGSLESWLTDRYCLYAQRRGRLLRGEIDHAPWPLRRARARFKDNELAAASRFELPDDEPHLLYADRLDVVAWSPRPF